MVVRSLLEYCAPLFIGMPITDALKLQRVQRRFECYVAQSAQMVLCLLPQAVEWLSV